MKRLFTLTAAALLWGTASFAAVDADSIAAKFVADGYTNLDMVPQGSDWLVSALKDGKTVQFLVNGSTGEAVAVDAAGSAMKSLAGTGDDDDGEKGEGEKGEGGDDSDGDKD